MQNSSPISAFWQGKVQNSSPSSALLTWRHFRLTLSLTPSAPHTQYRKRFRASCNLKISQRRVSHDLVVVDDQQETKRRWLAKQDYVKLVCWEACDRRQVTDRKFAFYAPLSFLIFFVLVFVQFSFATAGILSQKEAQTVFTNTLIPQSVLVSTKFWGPRKDVLTNRNYVVKEKSLESPKTPKFQK